MFRKLMILKIILVGLILAIALGQAFSRVIEEKGKTYIVDRHGERWDVTALSASMKANMPTLTLYQNSGTTRWPTALSVTVPLPRLTDHL
jgi:hypothetical protein